MATNYSWNIAQLDTLPEHNGFTDVVQTVHYRIVGEDNVDGISATVYGTASVPLPEANDPDFVPFDQLTRQIVRDWIVGALKEEGMTRAEFVSNIQSQIEARIQKQRSPEVISKRPPWAN